jgi:Nup133 N terminal like
MESKFSLVPTQNLSSGLSVHKPLAENPVAKKPLGPPAATKKVITEELGRLKCAISGSQTLETYMSLEEKYLELKDFHDHSQPEESYQQSYPDYIKKNVYEIPETLLDKYNTESESSILSGLLPEIQKVWYSFDNVIYFWDYLRTNSLIEYPVAEDIIVNVTLIPKNTELFTNKVYCMLLIATKNQISFVGISIDPEFKLIESDIKTTTDEVPIQCIAVLENGRILMGGADGSISELKYSSDSWFSSTKRYKRSDISSSFFSILLPKFIKDYNSNRVLEISVDSSRNILYSLINNDAGKYRIEVYDLGPESNKNKKVCKITSAQVLQRLREYSQRMCNLNPDRLEIIHIEALSRAFTTEFHLLGLTRNGIRIYFSFHEQPTDVSLIDPILSLRPVSEFSIYIKFPPAAVKLDTRLDFKTYSLGITSDKPTSYEKCIMSETGNLIILEQGDRINRVLSMGRSLSRIALYQGERARNMLEPEETVSCIDELRESEVQHIKEVKSYTKMTPNIAKLCNHLPRGDYRTKIATRYLGSSPGTLSFECISNLGNILYRPSSDLLVLTSRQLIQFIEIRPIDLLYQALTSDHDGQKTIEFVQKFGVLHTCAMLLGLVIGPVSIYSPDGIVETPLPDREKAKAFNLFKDIGNSKVVDNNMYSYRPDDPLMVLSEYRALYVYAARILRPIWEDNISHCQGEIFNQIEQFQAAQLREVKTRLEKLKIFLTTNYAENTKKGGNCIYNLCELIKRNEDCLELLILITEDYSFRRVVNELILEDQTLLKDITYRELVSTSAGHSLAKSLIEAYILQLRNPRASRQRRPSLEDCLKSLNLKCSSFFTLVDSEIYIAQECLYKALSSDHHQQRNDLIEEAMKRLLRNAASVGLGKITYELKQLKFYRGIVCLCIQKAIDINDIKAEEGANEVEECYTYLTQLLNDLKDCLLGLYTSSYWFSDIPLQSLYGIKDEVVSEFCKHQDKNVHKILFTWLIDCGLSHEILAIDSPFVKPFIEESTKKGLINETSLLGKYCMKVKDFINAYKEFDRLASLKKNDLKFEDRIEYLNLCSHCIDKYIEGFKGYLEEKTLLEQERDNHIAKKRLARIQFNIRQELLYKHTFMPQYPLPDPKVLDELNKELLSVNDLFDKYAKKHNLYISQFELLDYIYSYTSGDKKEIESIMKSTYIPLIKEYINIQWPAAISEKLEELGTKYPYGFNLKYIITKVEQINSEKNIESNWLVTLVASLPIDEGYSEIWSIYYENWKNSFVNIGLLFVYCLRLEAVLRAWFGDLKKRLIEAAIWNKNSKEKASPHKFIEKSQELSNFFSEYKVIKDYLSVDRCLKLTSCIEIQENIFKTLKNDIIPSELSNNVLKKKINFELD